MNEKMKKIYIAPLMEQDNMEFVLPLCTSGVAGNDSVQGNDLVNDVLFGGIDEYGLLDPS